MFTNKIIGITLGSALLLCPVWLSARQDQGQDNVVEAARKAQAAKKTAPKAKMTIDNDNLNTLTGTVNVVGQEPAAPAAPDKAAPDKTKTPTGKAPVKDEAYWRNTFDAANKKLADDSHELDILQREYNLKQQQYYSDPNTAMIQDYSRQDLTDTKQKIDDKTAAVAQDKQDIAGVPAQGPAQSQPEVPAQPPAQ
jgi:hypothetical protein